MKLRLVFSDGSVAYENGDVTPTRAVSSHCQCGYKHWWNGKEYDNHPDLVSGNRMHSVSSDELNGLYMMLNVLRHGSVISFCCNTPNSCKIVFVLCVQIPVMMAWKGREATEVIAWFQYESDPSLNSNVFHVASCVVQKHFPGTGQRSRVILL